jgi:hypothetical protein
MKAFHLIINALSDKRLPTGNAFTASLCPKQTQRIDSMDFGISKLNFKKSSALTFSLAVFRPFTDQLC